jgi:hypothetical protein
MSLPPLRHYWTIRAVALCGDPISEADQDWRDPADLPRHTVRCYLCGEVDDLRPVRSVKPWRFICARGCG